MGLFGLSQKGKLNYTIDQVNSRIIKVNNILDKNGNCKSLSNLSYSELMELKHLGEEILIWANKVPEILERDQKLMLTRVSGSWGSIEVTSWMMWIMQWYSCFERDVCPYLPIC